MLLNKTLRTALMAGLLSCAAGITYATAQDAYVITPEQDVVIREYVAKQPPAVVVERPSNFELIVGAVVPDIFKPGALSDNMVPGHKLQYVVIDGQTVLIEPETRRIVHIVR
ncbi:DUF1236 domain-containing protein [Escherichia coli]|nr:DUF1236 domain-containing protein [Salmonella enterica subsp. enterica]ECI7719538.1 DUF1236 domain-containing protein [Salmonella enterica subsp. enterica]EFG2886146.1 DUF1236 domain-containing protein [Escherichia coli]